MTTTAAQLLISRIMPLIVGAIARGSIRPVGCEDTHELAQDTLAMAAAILDRAEAAGKPYTAGTIAHYALQAAKSGRRTHCTGRMDVMAPATMLAGRVSVESMDAPVESSDDDGELTLHGVLADQHEDTDTAAARRIDWELVTSTLDDRRRQVLLGTAEGYGTAEVAAMCDVSAPYICQLRKSIGRNIVDAWGDNGLANVTTESSWRAGMRAASERRAARYERAVRRGGLEMNQARVAPPRWWLLKTQNRRPDGTTCVVVRVPGHAVVILSRSNPAVVPCGTEPSRRHPLWPSAPTGRERLWK